MPAYQMGQSNISKASWAGAGFAAGLGYDGVKTIAKDAKVGKVLGIGQLGLGVLQGNAAQSLANQAMSNANNMSATGALAAADTPLIRNALQQLSQAVQAGNIMGYTGLATSTQPTASASVAAAAQPQNLVGFGLIALLGWAILKD